MMKDVTTITQPTRDVLTEREEADYTSFKEALIQWLDKMGKNPGKAEGYARETVRQISTRVDTFYRWI